MTRALIGAALLAAVFGAGYLTGSRIEAAQHERALLAAKEDAEREAAKLRTLTATWLLERDARLDLERQLDDAARQDPDAGRPAFGAGSVQRLNKVR